MLRLAARAWRRWLKVAEFLGTVQMVVLLSIVYWTAITLVAVPFKLLADPLSFRRRGRVRWIPRARATDVLESMRRQG